jgi:hypothetical protein
MQVATPDQFELWEAVMWELAKRSKEETDGQSIINATVSHYWAITHIDWIRLHRPPPEVSEAEQFLAGIPATAVDTVLADMTAQGWFTDNNPTIPEWINVQYTYNN